MIIIDPTKEELLDEINRLRNRNRELTYELAKSNEQINNLADRVQFLYEYFVELKTMQVIGQKHPHLQSEYMALLVAMRLVENWDEIQTDVIDGDIDNIYYGN